jgi:hypothetical protein
VELKNWRVAVAQGKRRRKKKKKKKKKTIQPPVNVCVRAPANIQSCSISPDLRHEED